jgi:hypothetical protein
MDRLHDPCNRLSAAHIARFLRAICQTPAPCILLAALLSSAEAAVDFPPPAGGRIPADAEDIRMEIARRQEDINRIDQKLALMGPELARLKAAMEQADALAAEKGEKLRKLIIVQDQMRKGDLLSLLASSGNFQDALVSIRIYAKIMEESVSEYGAAAKKRSALLEDIKNFENEIENQKEIKNLLEKRKKELQNRLHTASDIKRYI